MNKAKSIKFVKKASSWCLTYFIFKDQKDIQKQEWFSTFEEAEKRANELKNAEH